MKRLFILLISLVLIAELHAHPNEFENDGTNPILGKNSANKSIFGDNYGGYGYLASSESEAHQQMQVLCDPEVQKKYLSIYCRGKVVDPNRTMGDLVDDTMRSVVLYHLNTHASEYLALNIKAAAQSLGKTIDLQRPVCVSENSPLWQRAIKKNYGLKSKMSAKAEAIAATLEGDNLAQALMYGERLEAGSEQNACESFNGLRSPSCGSIQHTSYRLRTSFPVLYEYSVQGTGQNPVALTSKTSHYDAFRRSLAYLMGAHNAGNISRDEAKKRGLAFLKDGTKLGPYRALEDRFNLALEAASRESSQSLLGKAYRDYKNAMRSLREDHLDRMTKELDNLCKNKLSIFSFGKHAMANIYSMALQYPNVVRQTILDMSPLERGPTSAVLCGLGVMPLMQREPQCHGVSGGPLPENDIDVARRKINDWPNSSQNYFRVSRPKTPVDAPMTIRLNVNFTLGASLAGLPDEDHNGMPDQLECQLKSWQADINAWANCSVGATPSAQINFSNQSHCPIPTTTAPSTQKQTCPMNADMASLNPKVNFQINMQATNKKPPPPPSIQLHRCYRLDIPGPLSDRSDCENVKSIHINRCLTEHPEILTQCLSQTQNEQECRLSLIQYCRTEVETKFAADPGPLNRADSSNYTLGESFSVVRHEIFHQMGLADEYVGDERPYSLLGEHDSIMRNSGSLNSRLYPRHISQILDVLRCPEVSN